MRGLGKKMSTTLSMSGQTSHMTFVRNQDHGLINEFEYLYKQMTENAGNTDDEIGVPHIGMSDYVMYGYKKFESMIFNGTMQEKDKVFSGRHSSWDDELGLLVRNGEISINEDELARLEGSVILADEIHETHSNGMLNRAGITLALIMQKVKNITLIISDATPISRVSIEIVPILNMMLGKRLTVEELFTMTSGSLVPNARCFAMVDELAKRTYVLEQPDMSSYPSVVIEGERINLGGMPTMNYVKCPMSAEQKRLIRLHCSNRIMHRIGETAMMVENGKMLDGGSVSEDTLKRIMPTIDDCCLFAPKINMLNTLLFDKGMMWLPGLSAIYTALIIAPGTMLLKHYFNLLGLDEYGGTTKGNLCLDCNGPHIDNTHVRRPVYYSTLNRGMSDVKFADVFSTYTSKENMNGSSIKVLIVTNCVNVGVSLSETQRFFLYDPLPSVPAGIQFEGRFVRPNSIQNTQGDNIVHIFPFMVFDEEEETCEVQYARRVHENWQGTKPILVRLLNGARIIEFRDGDMPDTAYIDGPVLIPRKKFHKGKEINGYREFVIDNAKAKARLKRLKVNAHADSLLPAVTLRIRIASILIKSLLMMMPSITITQLKEIVRTHPPLLGYNVSVLTEEDFHTVGHIMNMVGEKMTVTMLNEIVNTARSEDDFDAILKLLITSPLSPWLINTDRRAMKVHLVDNIFYYSGDASPGLDPPLRKFVSHNDIFMPIDITVTSQEYNHKKHIDIISDALDRMRSDEPILNIFTKMHHLMLNTFLLSLLISKPIKSSGRIAEFVQLLEVMRLAVPRELAERVLSTTLESDHPLVYFDKSYHLMINGHLSDIDVKAVILNRKEPDVKLQVNSNKDVMKISFYNNARQDEPQEGNVRVQRGIEIYKSGVDPLLTRLRVRQSALGDKLISLFTPGITHAKFKENILLYFTKLQIENPDVNYIEFKW